MGEKQGLDFIIKSLRNVLIRGHSIIPVPHRDLRRLLDEVESLRGAPHDVLSIIDVTSDAPEAQDKQDQQVKAK